MERLVNDDDDADVHSGSKANIQSAAVAASKGATTAHSSSGPATPAGKHLSSANISTLATLSNQSSTSLQPKSGEHTAADAESGLQTRPNATVAALVANASMSAKGTVKPTDNNSLASHTTPSAVGFRKPSDGSGGSSRSDSSSILASKVNAQANKMATTKKKKTTKSVKLTGHMNPHPINHMLKPRYHLIIPKPGMDEDDTMKVQMVRPANPSGTAPKLASAVPKQTPDSTDPSWGGDFGWTGGDDYCGH
jgi:hypothetical protein